MKSWKTTTMGVLAIVSAITGALLAYLHGNAVDWTSVGVAVAAGVGLIQARDNDKTSEAAGAK